MITLSFLISFVILVGLVMAGTQNLTTPMQVRFAWWTLQMSLSAVITWAAVAGAVCMAFLSLPGLSRKTFQARRLRKELQRLEKLCKYEG